MVIDARHSLFWVSTGVIQFRIINVALNSSRRIMFALIFAETVVELTLSIDVSTFAVPSVTLV